MTEKSVDKGYYPIKRESMFSVKRYKLKNKKVKTIVGDSKYLITFLRIVYHCKGK